MLYHQRKTSRIQAKGIYMIKNDSPCTVDWKFAFLAIREN